MNHQEDANVMVMRVIYKHNFLEEGLILNSASYIDVMMETSIMAGFVPRMRKSLTCSYYRNRVHRVVEALGYEFCC